MVVRTILATAFCASLVITPIGVSWAAPSRQDIAAAQEAFKEGLAAEKKADWKVARDAFQRAVDGNDSPDARLHLGRAESHLGHLTEANDHYKAVQDSKTALPPTKAAAKKEQQAVTERIPRVTIKVPAGFSGTVRIDKVELTASSYGQPIEVNPGTRSVVVESSGFQPFTKSLVLSDRSTETVEVQLVAAPVTKTEEPVKVSTSDGSTRRLLGYISLGVGGAGLIVGTGFGLAARSTRNDLKSSCIDNLCAESQRDTYDRGKTQADIATVGFIIAGVGVGAGVVLLLTAPSKKESDAKASITPYVGPMSLGVNGRF